MIERTIQQKLEAELFKGKVIVILGPRQVGKTTLMKTLVAKYENANWLNADEADIKSGIEDAATSTKLRQIIGPRAELVIIDEAQQIVGIGHKIKLLYDSYSDLQIVVSGSSALDLHNSLDEPLTGRKVEYHLFPFSSDELAINTSLLEEQRKLETRLIYGSYPEVINNPGREKEVLVELSNSYLYKDILIFDGIKKSSFIQKLLVALALQVGSEVRYHELAKTIGNIDPATVEKYLDILEKMFVIYKLPAFSRNLRNELKKGKKYYFYDNGIRNILINNFNYLEFRQDKGALWENYLLIERWKKNSYNSRHVLRYFWRTHDQAEIDYIEEIDGTLHAFEFKWKKGKKRFPVSFLTAYPTHTTQVVTQDNYLEFVSALNY